MSKGKILVVDPDEDIRNMVDIYFTRQGFEIVCVADGENAIEAAHEGFFPPDIILMENNLSDIYGYEVCKELRNTTRTSHIPIIFFAQKDELSDKIRGLELGADDFITKPFDIEELKLRIQNSISWLEPIKKLDSITNFPKGAYTEDHLRQLIKTKRSWSYVDIWIRSFDPYSDLYNWQDSNKVLVKFAEMLRALVAEFGTDDDFIGHPGRNHFIVMTHIDNVDTLVKALRERFNQVIEQQYMPDDWERGYMLDVDQEYDLMSLGIGVVRSKYDKFSSIGEIVEMAARNRMPKLPPKDDDILTEW
jgi:PleD family two-component response regulator